MDYTISKEFHVNITTAPFKFEVQLGTTDVIMKNNTSNLPITIKNNEEVLYNTDYEIAIECSDKFNIKLGEENLANSTVKKTLSKGNTVSENLNLIFNADTKNIEISQNATLKITTKSPYAKEIEIPITIKIYETVVTLNANGGTVNPSSITVYNGRTYEDLPTPIWTGHIFNGWYTSAEGGTKYETTTAVTTNDNTQTLYAQWTSVLLADFVQVGDFVNYPVTYTNVNTNTTDNNRKASDTGYSGWRVLSVTGSGDEKYVRLVSAGIPLTYYHPWTTTASTATASLKNITTGFFDTAIKTTATSNYYHLCGFKNGATTLTTISAVEALFNNDYTQKNSSGRPQVTSMTKKDVDIVYYGDSNNDGEPDSETTNAKYLTDNNLLAIPASDTTGYVSYHLATIASSYYLWEVYYEGAIIYTAGDHGVRPVVSLKASVITTGQTNGVWQISI